GLASGRDRQRRRRCVPAATGGDQPRAVPPRGRADGDPRGARGGGTRAVKPGRAEIAGAGLVGLSTALLLRRAGWSVRVHEQSPAIREIGAGISLHQGACAVLEHLGLLDTVLANGVDLDASQAIDRTGKVLADRPLAGAYRQLAIPRQTLIRLLADA